MLRSALLALLLLSFAAKAQAWTRAHVREVDAQLTLDGTSEVQVALELGVEVSGGWLERLEIPGLTALPEEAESLEATLFAEDGSEHRPEIRLKHEVLGLRFSRTDAARRGRHRLLVRYSLPATALASAAESAAARLEWTLPGWEAGLTRASIHWIVPSAARALPDSELAEQITRAELPERRSKISFLRVHVPRESPWSVAVELPRGALHPVEKGTASLQASSGWSGRTPFALASVLVFLLACWARRQVRIRAAREGFAVRNAWLSMLRLRDGAAGPITLAGALVLLAVAVSSRSLAAALSALLVATLLFVDRVQASGARPGARPFEALGSSGRARQRRALRNERLGLWNLVDADSMLGACLIAVCLAALYLGAGGLHAEGEPWQLAAACGVVPALASARFRFPHSFAVRVERLLRAVRGLELNGVSFALVWRRGGDGSPHEVRLRVFSARPHRGLLRIDVLPDSRPECAGLTLCAVVLAESSAARALQENWPEAVSLKSGSEKRLAFVKSTQDLARDLERLLAALASHEQRTLAGLVGEAARDAA